MKKFLLILFILFDGLVIVASVMFLMNRYKIDKGAAAATPMTPASVPAVPAITSIPPLSTGTVTVSTATPAAAAGAASTTPTGGRKILFSYRNAKAKKVMIRADFTGWRAEAMTKDPATNKWTYMAILEPGEYAYCFSVDDKSIRDPANKRTKQVGKTRVSSIVVQASSAVPH